MVKKQTKQISSSRTPRLLATHDLAAVQGGASQIEYAVLYAPAPRATAIEYG
jgi:hypothetical protein